MTNTTIPGGVVHALPLDLQERLLASPLAFKAWNDITPLARNEWICWVESAKHIETRERRSKRVAEELTSGKRRPCCWAGCIHRLKNSTS